jgi:DNA polymerase
LRLGLDFETYYDDVYNLKKMHTLEYVRDERFKVHCVGIKLEHLDTIYLDADLIPGYLHALEETGNDIELVCHNTYFDGLILFHHYGYVPTVYRDTLSMARAVLIHAESHSLDYLCNLLGIEGKVPDILQLTKGLRTLQPEIALRLGEYAINDVDITLELYERLLPALPEDELALIDLTIRWACRPVLHVDLPRIVKAYRKAARSRRARIKGSGTSLQVLSSQQQFVNHLEGLSIEVPYKTNKKGKQIPALAKDDLGFRQMIADNPDHKALFDGRLAAKSTLEVTRIKRLYRIGSRGTLPMPLKFYGAHTGRWSGMDGLNVQNFTRNSELRKSIIAPPGYVILVADLKQIEARLNMWFCREAKWLAVFAAGQDIYQATAASHFGIDYDDVSKEQRFFGKTLELGLGYNMGWKKFRVQSALKGIFLSEEDAYRAVAAYRNNHIFLGSTWKYLTAQLSGMYRKNWSYDMHPITLVHEGIELPNGMRLDYSGLEPEEGGNWHYGLGNKYKKIYGGAMLENIIQALARIILGDILLAIESRGIRTVSSTHDEPIMVVRDSDAPAAAKIVTEIMTTPPEWAPELPMAVDVGWAREYSK